MSPVVVEGFFQHLPSSGEWHANYFTDVYWNSKAIIMGQWTGLRCRYLAFGKRCCSAAVVAEE